MGTPYPTSDPGYLPAARRDELIQPPDWVKFQVGERVRELSLFTYREGYLTGWTNSSDQYTEQRDLLRTVDYILRVQGVGDAEREELLEDIRNVLPVEHGGGSGNRCSDYGLDDLRADVRNAARRCLSRDESRFHGIRELLEETAKKLRDEA